MMVEGAHAEIAHLCRGISGSPFSPCAPLASMCALVFDEARMEALMGGGAVAGSDQ